MFAIKLPCAAQTGRINAINVFMISSFISQPGFRHCMLRRVLDHEWDQASTSSATAPE